MLTRRISLYLLMTVLAAGLGSAQMRSTKPTARAHLDKVSETAKAWAADAALISVNSNQVNEDGSAPAWTYTFYSRRKTKWNLITAKGREITNFEVAQGSDKPIKELFADSDIVISEAALNGLKGKSPRMNLSSAGWIVRGGDDPGDAIITINPTSGAFVKKSAVPRN
ncbi:MAG: hypothetical protein EXQ56_12355 [Acidobacteria bacterium]|nr:hypothetical protein [Acidobacteriota bacterium]